MITPKEYPFWIAFSNIPGRIVNSRTKNSVLEYCLSENISLSWFFNSEHTQLEKLFSLSAEQLRAIDSEKAKLPNYSFLVEDMISQGYDLIPKHDPDYPSNLKKNLGESAPILLYIKGNKKLLHKKCTAIVGARNSGEIALDFTDYIAHRAVIYDSPVVSGYAKGVDRQALESALKYKGESIIVLPQGIMTFYSIRSMYKEIVNGKILVLSVFQSNAPWHKTLAMARNSIIYALADSIYVAESNESGGTWSGVMDGLRKGRIIYVRKPFDTEKNANKLLIQRGCTPYQYPELLEEDDKTAQETNYQEQTVEDKINQILKESKLTLKQIKSEFTPQWSEDKLRKYLKSIPQIQIEKFGKSYTYTLLKEHSLF